MAEQKINDAESLIEVQLTSSNHDRKEYLELYYEIFSIKHKKFPTKLLLELARFKLNEGHAEWVIKNLQETSDKASQVSKLKIEIEAYESLGHFHELYRKIYEFLILQFEKKLPLIDEKILKIQKKYFQNDFGLKLTILSLSILKEDQENSELIIKELILSIFEAKNSKNVEGKLDSIIEIIQTRRKKSILDIYQVLCQFIMKNKIERNELKKIIEFIIYFEDFQFQVIILSLLDKFDLKSEAQSFSKVVKKNSAFNFVYFDKFFPHLKNFFLITKNEINKSGTLNEAIDLNLQISEKQEWILENIDFRDESYVNEMQQILKFSNFSHQQLYDLAISFIQSGMPLVALVIMEKVLEENLEQDFKLKILYLKANCLFEVKDFRRVVDVCHDAIRLFQDEKQAVSFLYNQAEAFVHLREFKEAKKNFLKVVSIDETYRMTKDRLRTLDEY
jgi:hypothetical protein